MDEFDQGKEDGDSGKESKIGRKTETFKVRFHIYILMRGFAYGAPLLCGFDKKSGR